MRRNGRRAAVFLAAVLCTASGTGDLAAQSLRGTVVEEGSDAPVAGALVLLVDPAGAVQGSAVTGAAGAWILAAPGPGEWSLTVERIGFASTTAGPFRLAAGASRSVPIVVSSAPVALPAITVESETATCRLRPSEGETVFRLWDEVRKALTLSALTEAQIVFETEVRERVVTPWGESVGDEHTEYVTTAGRSPFRVPPAEVLVERGFVQDSVGGRLAFYGPDASLLLSDPFLDTHCFRTRRGQEGVVGLEFEPATASTKVDVRGTLWLDERTSELRAIDFAYTGLRERGDLGMGPEADGHVAFDRLEDGGWIVREWAIRIPIDSSTYGGRTYKLYQERSGSVTATRPAPAVRTRQPVPSIYDHGARRDTTQT